MKTTITTALATTVLATGLALPATAQTVLRLSTYVNEIDVRYEGFRHFADIVAERSGGSVEVQIFPSSTLHGWSEGIDALQGGVSDISWIPADERLPCYRVTSLYPAQVDLENQVAMDAAYADLIRDEAAAIGLVPLFNSNYSYDQEWWFEEPIADLGDLGGRQVRSIGPLVSMMIETWGGAPVFVAPSEVFQSAERGVVDGINMGVATYSSWQLWDVMPYMVHASLFYGNIIYMMSEGAHDRLTPEEREIVMQAAADTEAWLQPRYEAWVDAQVGNAVMSGGGAAVSLTTEESAALLASVTGPWNEQVTAACGPELAGQILDLFAANAP